MNKLLPLALGAVLAACGPGAVNPANLIQPTVRVDHLAIKNVGLSGGTLDVVLAFNNPNHFTLPATRLKAGLDIEGSHFGDIDVVNAFTLADRDTTLVTVPLTFRWSAVGGAARSVLDYGAVNYGINGTFTIAPTPSTAFDVPFSGQGNVPLLKP